MLPVAAGETRGQTQPKTTQFEMHPCFQPPQCVSLILTKCLPLFGQPIRAGTYISYAGTYYIMGFA